MKILVFDTETTNILPNDVPIMRKFLHHFPSVVQLSFILYDTYTNEVIESHDYVVKIPEHVPLSQESIDIHGIDREIMEERGVDITHALNEFRKCYLKCNKLVAHNIKFDTTMITVESMRSEIKSIINVIDPNRKCYCTMRNSIDICNIEVTSKSGKTYHKFPKQIELHKLLFGDTINEEKLHNSFIDILVCLRCYMMMEHKLDVIEKDAVINEHFSKISK
jgi:DNA polymerase III epsilon subunit-like protein